MITAIKEKLPNPDASDPQGKTFDDYIILTEIRTSTEPVVTHYQGAVGGGYLDAEHLNHSLTLLAYGEDSKYSDEAENNYGRELDD